MADAGSEGSRGWRWRPKGTAPPPESLLLYEPGNRGDLLKAAWLAAIAGLLGDARGRAVLDLCAGAPSYPLAPAARELRDRAPPALRALIARAAGDERWPAAGLIIHVARAEAGAPGPLRVFDRDPARLAAWRGIDGALPLAGESGEAILGAIAAEPRGPDTPPVPPALLIVDPYDLFHRLGPWLRPLSRALPAIPALLYLHNTSPRGAGPADQYRRVRARLLALAAGAGIAPIVGRIASDEREPRALHELWLLAPAELRARLCDPLADATRDLAARLPGDGGLSAFEG